MDFSFPKTNKDFHAPSTQTKQQAPNFQQGIRVVSHPEFPNHAR
jgi:uncharacterized protein YozE (UPF0346 family)